MSTKITFRLLVTLFVINIKLKTAIHEPKDVYDLFRVLSTSITFSEKTFDHQDVNNNGVYNNEMYFKQFYTLLRENFYIYNFYI